MSVVKACQKDDIPTKVIKMNEYLFAGLIAKDFNDCVDKDVFSDDLRIHWRLSTILETSGKTVWINIFWYVKVCIFWKFIQYTVHWDKIQIFKKLSSDKITAQKMPSFFFRKLQVITVLLLICDSYMSWGTGFVSLELWLGFSISDSVFIEVYCLMHGLFDFKTP